MLGLITFLVLIIFLAGIGWLVFLRPYVHDLARTQIDRALGGAVDRLELPPEAAELPAGQQIPLTETGFNNMIVLNLAPSNPVQKPETQITTEKIRVAFEIYGYPCAINLVPKVENARLVVDDIHIEGLAALVMSPEELAPLLNKHLATAQSKLPRAITAIELHNQEVLLTLG